MIHHALHEPARPCLPGPERVSALIARYPEVSRDEAREILTFLRNGRYRDVGVLTGDRGLAEKLDAFLKDHWIHFHVRSGQGEAIVGGTIILLFMLWAVWAALA